MKLEINNLAQIKEGVFEDSQFTVLVGDNGVGKTLLLETHTLISEYLSNNSNKIINNTLEKFGDGIEVNFPWDEINEFISSQQSLLKNKEDDEFIIEDYKTSVNFKEVTKPLNDFFENEVIKLYPKIFEEVNEKILFKKESNFKMRILDLPKVKEENIYNFYVVPSEDVILIALTMKDGQGKLVRESEIIHTDEEISKDLFLRNELKDRGLSNLYSFKLNLEEKIKERVKFLALKLSFQHYFLEKSTLYLPSERNLFVDTALRQAIKKMNENFTERSDSKSGIRYSELLFNSAYLEFTDRMKRFKNDGSRLLSKEISILNVLFGGELKLNEDGTAESIERDGQTIVRKELFSTKQNRIIPYILIFDPFKEYNKIIIEESEAHLSLKSIRDFVSFLNSLLELNKKLIITTHSEIFFQHLNNTILSDLNINSKVYELVQEGEMSVLKEAERTKYGYVIKFFNEELNRFFNESLNFQEKIDGEDND